MRVASIGECMVELSEQADGRITRAFGGDTLNTAVYMARLGLSVDYVTGLGDDPFSDEMVAGWQAEGVGVGLVERVPGRMPGLYIIRTDGKGERRFFYWRERAPAREVFSPAGTARVAGHLAGYDLVYLSGVSLSLYGEAGRGRLLAALDQLKARGGRIAFDTNFRPRGWPDRDEAKRAYERALARADFLFASVEDLELLYGADGEGAAERQAPAAELVLKLVEPGCRIRSGRERIEVMARPIADVLDTTAAGDSFAAAYLAARLDGVPPREAALAGHRLAGEVIRHRGAIIARAAMPAPLKR